MRAQSLTLLLVCKEPLSQTEMLQTHALITNSTFSIVILNYSAMMDRARVGILINGVLINVLKNPNKYDIFIRILKDYIHSFLWTMDYGLQRIVDIIVKVALVYTNSKRLVEAQGRE